MASPLCWPSCPIRPTCSRSRSTALSWQCCNREAHRQSWRLGWRRTKGIYLHSYGILSRGAIITGLLWGSILIFIIDLKLRWAAAFGLVAFLLSCTGLIRAERIGLNFSSVTIGYLLMALLFVLCDLIQSRQMPQNGDSVQLTD